MPLQEKKQNAVTAPVEATATKERPKLCNAKTNSGEINLISSRKQKSEARKKETVKASKRSITLYNKIRGCKWDEVLQHLDYYERDATNWIEEVNQDGSKRWRSLPIHLVSISICLLPISQALQLSLTYLYFYRLQFIRCASISLHLKWSVNCSEFIPRVSTRRTTVETCQFTLHAEKVQAKISYT